MQGVETIIVSMGLHPIGHNSEGVSFTTYSQRERLTPLERHGTTTLLGAPLIPLLGISNHNILIETWVVMQSDARLVAKIHSEPCGTWVYSSLDGDGPARS